MTHPSTVADTLDAGHTPGPWRVAGENCPECWQIENSEGDFIAQCEDRRGFASLDAVGNACLIAAAPDLLAALKGLIPDDIDDHPMDFTDEWHFARIAVAKARGEVQP